MQKPKLKPKLDICRRCPRFKIETEGREQDTGEIYILKLICDGSENWRQSEIAFEWKKPNHHFDFNEHFTIPENCVFKLEQVMLKGRRAENGNSFDTLADLSKHD